MQLRDLTGPQVEADGGDSAPDHHRSFGASPVQNAPAELGGNHEAQEEIQQNEAGLRRGLAQSDLGVLTGKEEHWNEHQHRYEQHDVLGQERPDAKDAHLDEGIRGAHLDEAEDDKKDDARDNAEPGTRVMPTPDRGLLKAHDAQAHPTCDQHESPIVDPGRLIGRDRIGDGDQYQGDDRDRYVHPEDRPPGPLGEDAAEYGTDRRQPAGDSEEQGQGLPPLVQAEGLYHDGQSGGKHDRRARSLDQAEHHYPGLSNRPFRSESAQGGRPGEDNHPENGHLLVPHGVGQAPPEGKEGGQRQQVGVDGPLNPSGA